MNKEIIGKHFILESNPNCIWQVIKYHRNNAYICRENVYNTTCEFYESEILANVLTEFD